VLCGTARGLVTLEFSNHTENKNILSAPIYLIKSLKIRAFRANLINFRCKTREVTAYLGGPPPGAIEGLSSLQRYETLYIRRT
jgi:hypothetical protein